MSKINTQNQSQTLETTEVSINTQKLPELTREHQQALERLGPDGTSMEEFLTAHPKLNQKTSEGRSEGSGGVSDDPNAPDDGSEGSGGVSDDSDGTEELLDADQKRRIAARLLLPTYVQNQREYYDAMTGEDE